MLHKSLSSLAMMVFVVVAVALAFVGLSTGLLGLIFGLPLALYIPGYALTTAFLPDNLQGQPVRLLCSVGLSIAITILAGLLLNLTPAGFQPYSWALTLGAISFFALLVAIARRWRDPAPRMTGPRAPRGTYALSLSNVVVLMVAAAVLVGAYMVTRSGALNQAYPGFTQLWLQHAGAATDKAVLVGVRNMEDEPVTYRIQVTVGGTLVAEWQSMALDNDQEWQQVVSLANQQLPPGDEVLVNLYRLDDPATVYRHASLYLQ